MAVGCQAVLRSARLLGVLAGVRPEMAPAPLRPGRGALGRRDPQRDDHHRDQRHDRQRHRADARRQDRRGRRQRADSRRAPRSTTAPASSSRPASSTRTRTSPTTRSTKAATSVSSMTGMEDVLDPTDINIYRDLAGGTTTVEHPARQRQRDRRQDRRHQAALGQDAGERSRLPGRAARASSSRSARTSRRKRGQAATGPQRFPSHPAGRGVRHPRRVHARQGLPEGLAGLRQRRRRPARTSWRRVATCSSTRWSRSSRASAWSTPTATAPTRS